MHDSFEGKAPKSPDRIRSFLEALRHAPAEGNAKSETVPAGPHIDGFQSEHQITVARFMDRDNARKFQQALNRSGMFSMSSISGRVTRVSVDYEDSHLAAEVYKNHKAKHPDQRPFADFRRNDCLIFGIGIGITLSFILFAPETNNPLAFGVVVAVLVFFAAVGHLFDRARLRRWRTGNWGFGVWDFLVACCLPFIGMLIVNLTSRIILGA